MSHLLLNPPLTVEDRYLFYCSLSSEIEFHMQRYTNFMKSLDVDFTNGYEDREKHPQGIIGAGLCALILESFEIDVYGWVKMENTLPELHNLRPYTWGEYWFPTTIEGWKQRLELVNRCIHETEQKLNAIS